MKKIYLFTLFLLAASGVWAQFTMNWNKQYQATASSNYSNEGRKVISDANSNYFVLGDYSSDMDSSGHNAGGTQYSVRLQKYDQNGLLLYWRFFNVGALINNGFDNRNAFGMEIDASGNVYIGYSVMNLQGNFDLVIQKLSNTLSTMWTFTYASSSGSNDVGVCFKLNGNSVAAIVKSYLGGNTTYSLIAASASAISSGALYSFDQNLDIVSGLAVNSSKYFYVTGSRLTSNVKTAMTACVSSVGTLKWKSTFNNGSVSGDDFGSDIVVSSDGYIMVVGTTYTSAAHGNDGIVMRYNSSGTLLGFILIDRSTSDLGGKILLGPAGYVFASSSNGTMLSVVKVQTANPLSAVASANYTPAPTAANTGVTNVSIGDMKVATSNNVYVCGAVTANSAAGSFNAPYLVKIGFQGLFFKVLNFQPVDGSFTDNASAVSMNLDGYKSDILVLRNKWNNNNNHSTEKLDLMDYDGGASLRSAQDDESTTIGISPVEFSLFPNPASDKITITSGDQIAFIVISDLTGKQVRTLEVNAADAEVSVADLNDGLYICKITTANGAVSVKRLMIN